MQFPAPLVQDEQTQKQLKEKAGIVTIIEETCCGLRKKLLQAPNYTHALDTTMSPLLPPVTA